MRLYCLFNSRRLSENFKLTLCKALIRSIMTYLYACPAWEFALDTYLLRLQRLIIQALRIIGNFPRHTPIFELQVAFKIPYVYGFVTKLCRQQAEVIQNQVTKNVCYTGQGEAQHRKCKRFTLRGGRAYYCSNT